MIPIILGAVALGTAAVGAFKGVEGAVGMHESNEIGKRAQERYELALQELRTNWEATNKSAEVYGQIQLYIRQRTIARFIDFIKKNLGQQATQDELKFLIEVGISVQQIQEYRAAVIEAQQFVKGGYQSVFAGAAASQGAASLATSVGVASTGTAISGLSGAAATNATLAWLGGGSLAAGGGGMALGSVILGGLTVGPALAVGGFMLASEGEKALTKAQDYEAQVNIEIANIDTAKDCLTQVKQRITELANLVYRLNHQADLALTDLESQKFAREQHASKFQKVALLIKALAEILKTPVLTDDGQLNIGTVTLLEKYRTL
jgi:hypothetical protein